MLISLQVSRCLVVFLVCDKLMLFMIINIVCRSLLLSNKVNNRELKEVDHFKYLGSVRTRDGYCTREIKMRITIAKEAFNGKMSLLTSKLNIELKKKLVRCYVCTIALYGSETWILIGVKTFGQL